MPRNIGEKSNLKIDKKININQKIQNKPFQKKQKFQNFNV